MPTIKREAVYASIRSQLMNEPQKGTILLLNILKLFADRKDDGEFVKELADLAGELAAAVAADYAQSPLFAQPVPMPYLQGNLPNSSIPVPSFSEYTRNESFKPQPSSEPKREIAGDIVSALNQMGEDTTHFMNNQPKEPVIEGYEEWKPKNKNKLNH